MAKWTMGKGLANYLEKLENLHGASPAIIGKAIYDGAKIVADEVKAEIYKIPIENRFVKDGDPLLSGITYLEKKGLIDGMGIAKIQTDGDYRNVKVGFDGYNEQESYYYGRIANQLIANSLESGTYFRKKNPFISRAVRRCRERAEMAMAKKVDEECAKIFKE